MLSTYWFRLHTTKAAYGLSPLLKIVLLLLLAVVARPGMTQGVTPTDDDTPNATSTPVNTPDVDQTLPNTDPAGDLTATPSVNDPTDAAEVSADTIPDNQEYQPSARPNYQPPDRYGDPFSNPPPRTPLYPRDPTQVETDIAVDDSTVNYSIYERINGLDYRAPSYLNLEQYQQYQDRRALQDYWRSRSSALDGESAVSGKRLIPPIYTTPIFDRLFGGSFVDIRPNGFVTLDFGGRFQRVENPAIPVRQQRNGNFEFDQQISLNVIGKIGEKLAVTANFDNNNSFDFQNNIKVEYTGYDHEIIKKIELGNVNLPVNNSLITGSQSLFGLKTQLQFGRLFVTSVASVQRGSSDAVTIENGSQSREFEVRSSAYDENRHFFLGHFFRDNYEQWLVSLPNVDSRLNVTRVEVYVINRTGNTETLRTVGAFMDLGEGYERAVFRDELFADGTSVTPAANNANELFATLKNFSRTPDGLEADLQQRYPDFVSATDYEIKTSVRKLNPQEYVFNSQLGYVTLNRQLQNDEMLAVAYEYTYNGQRYQVGELTEDYPESGRRPGDLPQVAAPHQDQRQRAHLGVDDEERVLAQRQPGDPRWLSAAHRVPRRPGGHRQSQPERRSRQRARPPAGGAAGTGPAQPQQRPGGQRRRQLRLCGGHHHRPQSGGGLLPGAGALRELPGPAVWARQQRPG